MTEELRFFLPPASPVPFFAELVGVSHCDGSYCIQRRESEYCVMEYVSRGRGTIVVNGRSYTAKAGDVYLLPMGSSHTYFSDKDDPWEKTFINASGELASILPRSYGLDTQIVFENCPASRLFSGLYDAACEDAPQEDVVNRLCIAFHEILLFVHRQVMPAAAGDEAALLKNLIDNRQNHVFSTGELAASIYRSEDYTIKLFQKRYGQTPHAYAAAQKMAAAKRLLATTTMPVREIGASLGYPDPSYFSNLFKRHTGFSPSSLRASQKK